MLNRLLLSILLLLPLSELTAEIITEQGSLKGFLLGEAPGCSYDNYVSHVVEGIADEGFNDYNPLDPQSDGFGNCVVLDEDDDQLLATFKELFSHCMRGDFTEAELLRETELSSYPYQLVRLLDTLQQAEYYLLREELDSSFVDENELPGPEDDEVGSFNFGWGLYIFAAGATNSRVLVEVPHPNDDYLSPQIGFDCFTTIGAGALFVSGAGREVVWTGHGGYNNSKSLSDPTRNGWHLFQMAHEAFFDYFVDEVSGASPLTVQVHSYDTEGRDNFPEVIIAPHYSDHVMNLPIFDWSGEIGGFIDRTAIPVHPAGVIGNAEPVAIEAFYGTNSSPRLVVIDSSLTEHELPNPGNLFGYPGNQQITYRYDLVTPCSDDEWLLHLEFDELPTSIGDSSEAAFYAEPGFPLTWQNFAPVVDYFHPVAANLEGALAAMTVYTDTFPPTPPANLRVLQLEPDWVLLGWDRARDPHFASYRLYYDSTAAVDQLSSYYDSGDISSLCAQTTTSVRINDLISEDSYFFRLAAIDLKDSLSALTAVLPVTPTDIEPVTITIGGSAGDPWLWWQSDSGMVHAVLTDNYAGVDGSALQYRRDWDQDEDYTDPGEEWITLSPRPDSTWIAATYTFGFAGPPAGGRFELRARDKNLAEWVYSGTDAAEGIEDDWQVFIDSDPPATPLELTVGEIGWDSWVDLTWDPIAADSTFESYLIFYAFEQQPDSSSSYLDRLSFSELADPARDSLRIDCLDQYGSYWLSIAVRDWAGNLSPLSAPLPVILPPTSSPFAFLSLNISADDNGNGIPEAGETVEFSVTLENRGTGYYPNVSGQLSTEAEFLELLVASAAFPGFTPGGTGTSLSPFRLRVTADAPGIFSTSLNLQLTFDQLVREVSVPFEGGVRELYYSYDAETASDWIHSAASGWNDQWHLSYEDYQSPVASWKCGDNGDGDYSGHLDAGLTSPPLQLLPDTQLSFRHRLQAETQSSHADSAYDGAVVELSLDNGYSWSLLEPLGEGYNAWFSFLSGDNPATHPFTPGIPCFSGSIDWREELIDLAAYADSTVYLRFRFGSDNSVQAEGWYLDDIALYGATPTLSVLTISIQYFTSSVVTISWEPHPDAIGYRVYRSSDPWSGFELLAETGEWSFSTSVAGADAWFYQVSWLTE